MSFKKYTKTEQIDVRVSGQVKALLQGAATARHMTVSEFILAAGIARAHEILMDQPHFLLSSEQWKEFNAALERPVQNKPHVRKLLIEPGVLG